MRIYTNDIFEVAYLASTELDYVNTVVEEDDWGLQCYFLFEGEKAAYYQELMESYEAVINLNKFRKNLKEFSRISIRDKRDFLNGKRLLYDYEEKILMFKEQTPLYGRRIVTKCAVEAAYYMSNSCILNRIVIERGVPRFEILGDKTRELYSSLCDDSAEIKVCNASVLIPELCKRAFRLKLSSVKV